MHSDRTAGMQAKNCPLCFFKEEVSDRLSCAFQMEININNINMRKIKLLLLTLLLTAIPNFLWAYTKDQIVSFDGEQTHYQVIQPDGTTGVQPTLRFLSTKKAGPLVIPANIDDHKGVTFTVVAVGSQGGYTSKEVTSVTLPNTIKDLGINCFSGSTKLEKINIPASVETITPPCIRRFENSPCLRGC